ncbi:hypothetical protein Ancab_028881 [Ancistrocladus abbreviatus]
MNDKKGEAKEATREMLSSSTRSYAEVIRMHSSKMVKENPWWPLVRQGIDKPGNLWEKAMAKQVWEFIFASVNAKIGDNSFIINVVEETSVEALYSSLLVATSSSNTEESSMVVKAIGDKVCTMAKPPHSSPRREKITILVLLPKPIVATP